MLKKINICLILMFVISAFVPILYAQSGSPPSFAESVKQTDQTVIITVEDLQAFRQMAAERDALQKECDVDVW